MAPGGRPSLNLSVGDEVEVYHHSDPEWWEVRIVLFGEGMVGTYIGVCVNSRWQVRSPGIPVIMPLTDVNSTSHRWEVLPSNTIA